MYNVGFGDCFLLYLPADGNCRQLVLVDFGRHLSSTSGHALSEVADDLIREARRNAPDGRAFFDVIVATHRHYDHIAGFDLKAAEQFEAGEVWLPWVENPDDPEAVALKQAQFDLADALENTLSPSDPSRALLNNSHHSFTNQHGLSNHGAMSNLQAGFKSGATIRYLPTPEEGRTLPSDGQLFGVKVHVLGPSRDEEVIAQLKPPKGKYYEFADQQLGRSPAPTVLVSGSSPLAGRFGHEYVVTKGAYRKRFERLFDDASFEHLRKAATFDTGMAATKLEDMINGTSLVLALEVGSAVVLLGGDAEYGTWKVILKDPEWRKLLARTTVYKVSHHGSYNGTPLEFGESLLPDTALSLVSLCAMERWPSIPRKSLIESLGRGERQLVRTDADAESSAGAVVERTDLYVDVEVPT